MLKRAAVVLLVLVFGFVLGFVSAPSERVEEPPPIPPVTDEANTACCEILHSEQEANYSLRQQLAYQEQAVVIEREACSALMQELRECVRDGSDMQEQLAFYRGIVSPGQARAGVRIFGLDLSPANDEVYQLELRLLQSGRRRRDVKGTAEFRLQGLRGNDAVTLSQDELTAGEAFDGSFTFRYYQELFGQIRVPADIKPLRLIVTVQVRGKSAKPVEQTYLWSELIAQPRDPIEDETSSSSTDG